MESFMQSLTGKKCVIYMPSYASAWPVKGEVLEYQDGWLKVRTSKGLELLQVAKIHRIAIQDERYPG